MGASKLMGNNTSAFFDLVCMNFIDKKKLPPEDIHFLYFEKNLVGPKKPTTLFSLPYRRLVCLVQLYEIFDLTKKEKVNSHQRECFLFNDMLVVTKIFSKKKNHTLYTYRCGFPLQNMNVVLFVTNRKLNSIEI